MHGTCVRADVSREAHVIFHVAGNSAFVVFKLAFELVEQTARWLAQGVHEDIQTTTVSHANDDVLDALRAGALDDVIHHWDQCVAAFKRETLLANILGTEITLETISGNQTLENALLLLSSALVSALTATFLHLFNQPKTLIRIVDMHDLGTDGTGIRLLHEINEFTQLHAFLAGNPARRKFRFQIRFGEVVRAERQFALLGIFPKTQRVNVCKKMATRTVCVNQAANIVLGCIFTGRIRGTGGGAHSRLRTSFGLRGGGDFCNYGRVGNITGFAAFEAVEVGLPLGIYRVGVD